MVMLATAEDLELRLGRTFDPTETLRVEAIIADVSAHVMSYTGNDFLDDYGELDVPAVVAAVVLQVAGRNFGTPADRSGFSQESAGPFSYSVGSAAASGLFLPGEMSVLNRFRLASRRRVGTIRTQPALGWS